MRSWLHPSSFQRAVPSLALMMVLLAGSRALAASREWEDLFDGRSLSGWAESNFEGDGSVKVVPSFRDGRGAIIIEPGTTLSGIRWARLAGPPRTNYELTLEAMRLEGGDFFCGLTFPVGQAACSLIVGGWGGMVVGISSIDQADASENETTAGTNFTDNRWYRIRVRVTDLRIEAWIDNRQFVNVEREGRTFSLRPGEIHKSLPLGIATYMTRAAIRDIRLRRL
jgi:hypothetical protein